MTNPLLGRIKLPGRIFQLPSKGRFYSADMFTPNVREAEVEVKPMSGLLEVKVKTPDLLYSGRVLEDICKECVPDILKPNELVTKDVEALFCFLRIVTYGSDMTVPFQHDCNGAKERKYKINLETLHPNNANIDAIMVASEVSLPNEQRVKLRPVKFNDVMTIMHLRTEIETLNLNDPESKKQLENMVSQLLILELMSMVESVDEVTDREQISEWLRQLPRPYWDIISQRGNEMAKWGFNLEQKFNCLDCNKEFTYDLQLDPIRFFTG